MITLQRSMLAGLDTGAPTPEAVCAALQNAVVLEHATIPLYLYSLYSLDPARNGAVAAILQSVVVEEMLHMVLAANVVNALGGSPQIDRPDFVPPYPGALPGGIESQLTVHLRPFSMVQLEDFLTIEKPEDPLVFKARAAAAPGAGPLTIGEFYERIKSSMAALPPGAFHGTPRNQVGPDLMDDAVVVTSLATATQAIDTIIDQGEGTSKSPLEQVGRDVAHYYRFMQIKKGRKLVAVANPAPGQQGWAYAGDPVPFDPAGVYPVPDDPKAAHYPPGSAQRAANDNFNGTYTALLRVLHGFVNGQANGQQFGAALGLMMSLKGQARAMASGIPNPAVHTGPSFEYAPQAI